jgi:enamine deaminase RidA (YjgF/YER057c/UK114 family)
VRATETAHPYAGWYFGDRSGCRRQRTIDRSEHSSPFGDNARMTRRTVRDGSDFEQLAGYARAVRAGAHVAVSGTAAMSDGIVLHPGDAYGQTREALDKALAAAGELGASADDVIRTRLLLAQGCDWHAAVRAHGETFAGIDPANTTYFVAGFIPEGVLVEVELDAIVSD